MTPQQRALSLYASGKYSAEIIEILADDFINVSDEQIIKIVEEMGDVHREKSIPLENINN